MLRTKNNSSQLLSIPPQLEATLQIFWPESVTHSLRNPLLKEIDIEILLRCTLQEPVLACSLKYFENPACSKILSETRYICLEALAHRQSAVALGPVRPTSPTRRSLLAIETQPQFSRGSAVCGRVLFGQGAPAPQRKCAGLLSTTSRK